MHVSFAGTHQALEGDVPQSQHFTTFYSLQLPNLHTLYKVFQCYLQSFHLTH